MHTHYKALSIITSLYNHTRLTTKLLEDKSHNFDSFTPDLELGP